MGLPSGIFLTSLSGRMVAVINAEWRLDGELIANGAADTDYILRLRVGSGSDEHTALVGADNQTAWVERFYSGGEAVPVVVEEVLASAPVGSTISVTNIRVVCQLLPPRSDPRLVTFDELLAQLNNVVGPMASTPQTPRWLPDASTGVNWYVRPLSAMATNQIAFDMRYSQLDTSDPSYDPDDWTTWTTFFNHPIAPPGVGGVRVRDTNPIDPASVDITAYFGWNWGGLTAPMKSEVRTDTTSVPGTTLYYIHAYDGPGLIGVDVFGQVKFQGTAYISWRYADLTVLNGTTYETAWPGLDAIDWSVIQPGDTLWVCGSFEDQTMNVQTSGTAGNYVKIRFDYGPDPGRIDQGRRITTPWTYNAATDEWTTPLADTTDCAMYEDGRRLIGVNTRSRTRLQVQHANVDYDQDSFFVGSIRRIQTGMEIIIGADFDTRNLPPGLSVNTRYYAIVVSSNWQFYSVSNAQYTLKLAATEADALAGIAVDIQPFVDAPPNTFFLVWIRQFDYPFFDQRPGELDPGQYCVDPVAGLLYYRPSGPGQPTDFELRLSSESYSGIGACILGSGVSYIRILGGGEYGGLFGDTPAPVGRVGLAHQNVIEFANGTDIVVDGMLIDGGRSGVTWINVTRGTVRNCRIKNMAHHACGGEDLATVEPDQLLERNWISDIGQGHDFGDAQALVTNPGCDRSVYRRNYCQRLGRNTKVTNPVAAVFDSSDDVVTFRNWFDDSHGHTCEIGAGAALGEEAFGGSARPLIACNIITRQGRGSDPSTNLIQRVGSFHATLNGPLDFGVWDIDIFGNLVAFSVIGDRAPDTLDECGLVYMRTNNNTTGRCEIRSFSRNAILNVEGPVFSLQQMVNTSPVVPSLISDYNLYATAPEFAQIVESNSSTRLVTIDPMYSGGQIIGSAGGYWSNDTGNDVHSLLAVQRPEDTPAEPTLAQLEYLRRWDDYDTYDRPVIGVVGNFPFE